MEGIILPTAHFWVLLSSIILVHTECDRCYAQNRRPK